MVVKLSGVKYASLCVFGMLLVASNMNAPMSAAVALSKRRIQDNTGAEKAEIGSIMADEAELVGDITEEFSECTEKLIRLNKTEKLLQKKCDILTDNGLKLFAKKYGFFAADLGPMLQEIITNASTKQEVASLIHTLRKRATGPLLDEIASMYNKIRWNNYYFDIGDPDGSVNKWVSAVNDATSSSELERIFETAKMDNARYQLLKHLTDHEKTMLPAPVDKYRLNYAAGNLLTELSDAKELAFAKVFLDKTRVLEGHSEETLSSIADEIRLDTTFHKLESDVRDFLHRKVTHKRCFDSDGLRKIKAIYAGTGQAEVKNAVMQVVEPFIMKTPSYSCEDDVESKIIEVDEMVAGLFENVPAQAVLIVQNGDRKKAHSIRKHLLESALKTSRFDDLLGLMRAHYHSSGCDDVVSLGSDIVPAMDVTCCATADSSTKKLMVFIVHLQNGVGDFIHLREIFTFFRSAFPHVDATFLAFSSKPRGQQETKKDWSRFENFGINDLVLQTAKVPGSASEYVFSAERALNNEEGFDFMERLYEVQRFYPGGIYLQAVSAGGDNGTHAAWPTFYAREWISRSTTSMMQTGENGGLEHNMMDQAFDWNKNTEILVDWRSGNMFLLPDLNENGGIIADINRALCTSYQDVYGGCGDHCLLGSNRNRFPITSSSNDVNTQKWFSERKLGMLANYTDAPEAAVRLLAVPARDADAAGCVLDRYYINARHVSTSAGFLQSGSRAATSTSTLPLAHPEDADFQYWTDKKVSGLKKLGAACGIPEIDDWEFIPETPVFPKVLLLKSSMQDTNRGRIEMVRFLSYQVGLRIDIGETLSVVTTDAVLGYIESTYDFSPKAFDDSTGDDKRLSFSTGGEESQCVLVFVNSEPHFAPEKVSEETCPLGVKTVRFYTEKAVGLDTGSCGRIENDDEYRAVTSFSSINAISAGDDAFSTSLTLGIHEPAFLTSTAHTPTYFNGKFFHNVLLREYQGDKEHLIRFYSITSDTGAWYKSDRANEIAADLELPNSLVDYYTGTRSIDVAKLDLEWTRFREWYLQNKNSWSFLYNRYIRDLEL